MNAPVKCQATPYTFTTYITRTVGNMSNGAEREFEVEVTYSVTPGRDACWNGDYPHPAEPHEVEVLTVKGMDDLTNEEWDRIQDEAEQLAPDALADEADSYADYRYEEYRDRIAPVSL